MTKAKRGRYTLEFKQEAVRLVESGQTMAAAARSLGVVEQTLGNWIKLQRAGTLKGTGGKQDRAHLRLDTELPSAGYAMGIPHRELPRLCAACLPVDATQTFMRWLLVS